MNFNLLEGGLKRVKGNFINNDGSMRKVWITLQDHEYKEMIMSHFKSLIRGGCAADYMSPDLEQILCGYGTGRYVDRGRVEVH